MLARMALRLRQIALVARTLAPVEHALTAIFATPVCYRDPGVGKYGLHNALWAFGGSFLEVVAPIQADTAAGRYLDRRAGDGGYMFIVDCDDLPARRAHLAGLGVRLVEDLHAGDAALWSEALHLHPKDTGGSSRAPIRPRSCARRRASVRPLAPTGSTSAACASCSARPNRRRRASRPAAAP
jgi:hypothetical protein